MTRQRSAEERIAQWLEDEASGSLPDHVLDATFERSRGTRQARRSAWRPFAMSRPIPALIAVGAAAIVILVGASLFGRRSEQPSVGATPSPSAITSPSTPPLGLALVNLDGSIRQELGLPRDVWMADLSADGAKLVFTTATFNVGFCGQCLAERYPAVVEVGRRTGAFMYPDDTGIKAASIENPAWSPDGSELAFSAQDATGNFDIYVARIRDPGAEILTGVARRLTTDPARDEFPAWSPDGSTIFYDNVGARALDSSGFSETQEIWSVPAAGGDPVRLTDNDVPDAHPDIAADGTVAYWRGGIWTMKGDGSDQARLTAVATEGVFMPRWSPDGRSLALLQYDPSERARMEPSLKLPIDLPLLRVIVVDVASGAVTEVGPRVASDVNPVSWTPDGGALLINRYDDPS